MGRYDALYHSSPPPTPAGRVKSGADRPHREDAPVVSSPPPMASPVQQDRSVEPNARTATPNASLLDEIAAPVPDDRRPTERYSFEIYTDLKPRIEEVQYRFKQRTGRKLSSSRIIREAIEAYLPEALRRLTDRTERAHRTGERSER